MKKLFLIAFLFNLTLNAQEEHAWVYFKDKANVQQALENPSSILTQKAIERKALRGNSIDERDVPVNEEYISVIKGREGIAVKAKSKWFNCIHVIGTPDEINDLLSLDFVSGVEFAKDALNSRQLQTTELKTDKLETYIDFEYGFAAAQTQMLNTDLLHKNDLTGENLTIAVLDAGFPNVQTIGAFDRLRNNGKLLGGYDFPNRSEDFNNPSLSNHGTLVLSTMAGFIQDKFTGTGPDASYYLFITEIAPTETPVEESYWVEAAERADSLGVDILNTSLGYTLFDDPGYSYSPGDMDGQTAFISRGANIASEKGLLVVTSAGNRGDEDYFQIIGAPADANVLTVGAVDQNKDKTIFSSPGPSVDGRIKPDVAAQGLDVVAIDEKNRLVQVNGTSFSSPILAGSIASFWQLNLSWTNVELMQLVRKSASMFTNPDTELGYGIPDFSRALQDYFAESNTPDELALYSNPVQDILRFSNSTQQGYDIKIFDTAGQMLLHKKNEKNQIDLTGFSRGFYIVMFEQNNKRNSFLIIKE